MDYCTMKKSQIEPWIRSTVTEKKETRRNSKNVQPPSITRSNPYKNKSRKVERLSIKSMAIPCLLSRGLQVRFLSGSPYFLGLTDNNFKNVQLGVQKNVQLLAIFMRMSCYEVNYNNQ